jgi:hypothetical protein
MKRLVLMPLIVLIVQQSFAGNHYTYGASSGVLDIKPTSVTPLLKAGDTLDFPANGVYTAFAVSNVQGAPDDSIVFRFLPGAIITTSYAHVMGDWTNVAYVKVIGLNSRNNMGTPIALRGKCHSISFEHCQIVNDPGKYSEHAAIIVDDSYGSDMYFTGSKAQTFYDIEWKYSRIEGYQHTDVVRLGTDNNRSICTDFVFACDTFRNMTNAGSMPVVPIAGTGFNFKIYDCVFENIMSTAGAGGVHVGNIFLYGYAEIYNNKFSNCYANDVRLCPLQWTGLPGYSGANARTRIYNNISFHKLSYSAFETSKNNAGPRISGNNGKVMLGRTDIYNNTVYYTKRASYNGDYYGFIADVYADSVTVHHNVIIAPEVDRAWDPKGRNYIVCMPGGPKAAFDSSNNRVFRTLAEAGITDTVQWKLSASSPLVNAADNNGQRAAFDIHRLARPQGGVNDIGAIELNSGTATNQVPVAKAGADIIITLPANTTTLNGSASSDPDGSIGSYTWSRISGPSQHSIANAGAATTNVSNLAQGVYSFRLVVTDNAGATDDDTVKVTVNAAVAVNQAPVAKAGTDMTITLPNNTVSLNGSSSSDADGSIAGYAWSKISGSSSFNIVNAGMATTNVTNLAQGVYAFRLAVTDNTGAAAADTISITVNAATPSNQLPVANAGTDITITLPVSTATLNGSGSRDNDGTIAGYAWSKISGPSSFTIANTGVVSTNVTGLALGVYSFRLAVTDNAGATTADTVLVTVKAIPISNQLPVANAGADIAITLPVNTATLNGSSSRDNDGTIASYAWSKISGPSSFTIANAGTATTNVTNLAQGVYSFRLVVTDNIGSTSADTVVVNVAKAAGLVAGSGTGLRGNYFNTASLSGTVVLSRVDATVDFNWGNASPGTGVMTDNFSVRWSGQVEPQYSETYTFYANTDDGVRLWVNGKQLVNDWISHSPKENSGTIALVAGQKYDIVMEYFDQSSGALAKLSWSSPSIAKAVVPKTQLYPTVVGVVPGGGTGLRGNYYNASTPSGTVKLSRVDATVDFNWGTASPGSGVNTDNFSVRWSGQVQAVYSETYTFYTTSDDGVRLWVNGKQLVNDWISHSPKESSGTITLVAGQKYDIVMEYFDQSSGALARLSWSSPSTAKAIIPKAQLFPAAQSVQSAPSIQSASSEISKVLTTGETIAVANAVIAPNPVVGGQPARLTINNAKEGAMNIAVLDMNGRVVNNRQINATAGTNTASINTAAFAKGMYVVRIAQGVEAITIKLIVQ